VDILCSCKQGFLLVQAALESELKAKEETHIAMAAAEEAAALVKVGIQVFTWHQLPTLPTIASVCNTANPVLTCLSSCRLHWQSKDLPIIGCKQLSQLYRRRSKQLW